MDIEELGLQLVRAYDKLRTVNADLKEEAGALRSELEFQIASMEQQLELEKGGLRADLNAQLSEFKKEMRAQTEELKKDFASCIGEAVQGQADDEEETSLLSAGLDSEFEAMKEQMQTTIKEMEFQSTQDISGLIAQTGDELASALEEAIARAKTLPADEIEDTTAAVETEEENEGILLPEMYNM